MSLENGDDNNVVSEGLAWFLHRQAWSSDYQPGLAAWAKLTVHVLEEDGTIDVRPQGVYVNVELPDKIVVLVTYTEPGLRGDTATRTLKPATVETGATVNVPLFVNEGELIRVNTKNGEYVERVKE